MATKSASVRTYLRKPKVKRRGVHSKTTQSTNKGSKNYVKPYVGQGR